MSAVNRMGNRVAGIDAHPGNYIVVGKVHEEGDENALADCYSELGLNCVNFSETDADYNFGTIPPDTAIFFEKLGLMLCGTSIRESNAPKLFSGVAAIHPYDRLRAIQAPRPSSATSYKGKTKTKAKAGAESLKPIDAEVAQPAVTDEQWGLKAIGALDSGFTGKGVRVCVIDTGLDIFHKDLEKIDDDHQRSFVGGSTVMGDHPGHGTRCAGIVGGKATPRIGPRYSVAPDAELFFARVLGDDGIRIENLIAALGWAVEKECEVVSMSIGDDFRDTVFSSEAMEIAAAAALAAGTLIVAGAGNDSERPLGPIRAVDHPANCASIMAVAAVGPNLAVAPYSNAAPQPWKPCVDIAAPGTSRSSTFPNSYATASGTSIATPFVAGVAALYVEACKVRGQALWNLMCAKAKKLPNQEERDVGAGLVQAPRKADKNLCDAAP